MAGRPAGTLRVMVFLTISSSLVVAVVVWLLLTGRASSSPIRWFVSLCLPLVIAAYGLRRRSLDKNGAALAVLVGVLLTLSSACFCSSLIAFFITGSRLTKWKKGEKQKFEPEGESVTRDWRQVFCNGAVASAASLVYLYSAGMGEQLLLPKLKLTTMSSLACLASISCCCGDTWASEIGSAISMSPRLITTLKPVPRGTNGGVSLPGLVASAAGGMLIGMVYYSTSLLMITGSYSSIEWVVIPVGLFSGLFGSLVDSLLGATLQFSGVNSRTGKISHGPGANITHVTGLDVLSNNTVNLLSSLITALATPLLVQVLL